MAAGVAAPSGNADVACSSSVMGTSVMAVSRNVRVQPVAASGGANALAGTVPGSHGTTARSGHVYDALILKCAERAGVETVYTWNTGHFERVAWRAMAGRIRTP
jgi:hypothetical protein